ncbi:MAG: SDR family oxidoreductase [Planctomycetaceae bacterium]|jgi:NAD(P)-dependent dehydrogenase (short-subunit alcohol dehydrogenase family)|nr:SDR family oxidoreductase [Planctomycetaceae bacterium]
MAQHLFDLTGKKALVTGAAVGIGRGYAVALAKAGADVAVIDLDEKTGQKTTKEIKSFGKNSIFVRCDVTKKDQVDAMIADVIKKFGHLDIGVNNAGIGILGGDLEFTHENWNKVINVNLTGMYLCAQAEARQFVKQNPVGGKIINTASMSARICNCNASYNASKGGVVEMTRMLAAEWGTYNINVNSISPSYILSPMHASTPLEVRARIRELTPLGYVQRPEDLYGPVIFLASEASNYVTGIDLLVDGGHTLNAWLTPLHREVPPRISPEQEIAQLKHDLAAMELPFDENGINKSLHPEIANAYKTAFGLTEN